MIRSTKINRRGKQPRQKGLNRRAELQLSKNIPLYSERTRRNITNNFIVKVNTTSKGYSMDDVSDVRYITFANILGSSEFTNMAAVYNNYRILAVSITALNQTYSQAPILFMDCDPQEPYGNPVNSRLICDDSCKLFSPKATQIEVVTWTFPGAGTNTNIWNDTSTLPTFGQISFGNVVVSTNGGLFELKVDMVVEFANPR